eukprot:412516_1
MFGGNLNYAVYSTAAILVGQSIFAFGGHSNGGSIRTWQYLNFDNITLPPVTSFPTMSPATTSTTANPTVVTTTVPAISNSSMSTTALPTLTTSLSITTLVTTGSTSICSDQDVGFLNTTYKLSTIPTLCAEGVQFIDIVSKLINIIDVRYRENNLFVHSDISDEQQQTFKDITICGNITFNVISCFNSTTNQDTLLNVTRSIDFVNDVNSQITVNQTIVVYIKNTTIIPISNTPNNKANHVVAIISSICSLLVCGVILGTVTIYYKKNITARHNKMIIENAMVILLAIGQYDDDSSPDAELKDSLLDDLDVDKDIQNLYTLFGPDNLGYTIYPKYDIKAPRIHWKQDEIIHLLKQKAEEFDKLNDFDGLIVVISSHGVSNNICTSDYKCISKIAIHRL